MTDKLNYDTCEQVDCPLPDAPSNQPSVIEREYFDQTGLTNYVQESFLTYDGVFALLEPHATLPYEGDFSVRTLQERFRGTHYGDIFNAVPVGEHLRVEDLYQRIDEQFRRDSVCAVNRDGTMDIAKDGKVRESTHDPVEWNGLATSYKFTARRLAPNIPLTEYNDMDVTFNRGMKNNQFVLKQNRMDFIHNPFDTSGIERLSSLGLYFDQFWLFERDENRGWTERGALIFVNVVEMAPDPKQNLQDSPLIPRPIVARKLRVLLNRSPLASEFFDVEKTFFSVGAEGGSDIIAPFPNDLPLPEDLILIG